MTPTDDPADVSKTTLWCPHERCAFFLRVQKSIANMAHEMHCPRCDAQLTTEGPLERQIAAGSQPNPLSVQLVPMSKDARKLPLSQRRILLLLAYGKRAKEIADMLGMAKSSVETTRGLIYQRIGHSGVADLVRFAISHGIASVQQFIEGELPPDLFAPAGPANRPDEMSDDE